MTGADLRAMIAKSGVAHVKVARDLHVDPRTLRRWMQLTRVRNVVVLAVRFVLDHQPDVDAAARRIMAELGVA